MVYELVDDAATIISSMDTILRDLISIQRGMLVTDSRVPFGMQAFHHSTNNAANPAASCFYKHKLKAQQKRSDFTNGSTDLWQNKYYASTPPTLIAHGNPFTSNGGHAKPYSTVPSADHQLQNAETSPYPHNPQLSYNQQAKASYYSPNALSATNRQTAPNMFAWQQSLQHQQQQQLQQRLSHQPPVPPATTQEELLANPQHNRFTDMFLRSQNPAGYIFSLNEGQNPWCQPPNTSKEGLFQQPTTKNICPLCGKNYARPSTLKTHMRIHSGERPFHCKVCNKSFSQAANLTAHLRVHSGEKPFSCPVCHKTFSQSSSVTTHMRTHSGDRPYKCPVCRKGFSDSSTLTKHLRIHSGEKPYRCSYCSMSFSQSGNLNRHMKVHEQPHKPESAASSVSPLANN